MSQKKISDPADDTVITWRTIAAVATDVLRITAYKLKGGVRDGPAEGHDDNDDDGEANIDEVDRDCGECGTVYLEQLDECANTLRQITRHDDDFRGLAIRLETLIDDVRQHLQQTIGYEDDTSAGDNGHPGNGADAQQDRRSMATTAAGIRKEITEGMDRAAADERAAAFRKWRDWLLHNIDSGARNAHRYLRLPQQWLPTTTLVTDGVISADPLKLLDGYRLKYKELVARKGRGSGEEARWLPW